jgi:hypothetical protein
VEVFALFTEATVAYVRPGVGLVSDARTYTKKPGPQSNV